MCKSCYLIQHFFWVVKSGHFHNSSETYFDVVESHQTAVVGVHVLKQRSSVLFTLRCSVTRQPICHHSPCKVSILICSWQVEDDIVRHTFISGIHHGFIDLYDNILVLPSDDFSHFGCAKSSVRRSLLKEVQTHEHVRIVSVPLSKVIKSAKVKVLDLNFILVQIIAFVLGV